MERIIQVFDPNTNSLRLFQGVALPQTNKMYFRFNGCFVDGGSDGLIIVIDHKGVIQGYEENGLQVLEPTEVKIPKLKHTRRTRSDKGKQRAKKTKKVKNALP
jgi:hypothetical protein